MFPKFAIKWVQAIVSQISQVLVKLERKFCSLFWAYELNILFGSGDRLAKGGWICVLFASIWIKSIALPKLLLLPLSSYSCLFWVTLTMCLLKSLRCYGYLFCIFLERSKEDSVTASRGALVSIFFTICAYTRLQKHFLRKYCKNKTQTLHTRNWPWDVFFDSMVLINLSALPLWIDEVSKSHRS